MRTLFASLVILSAATACGPGGSTADDCPTACTGDTVCVAAQCVPLFPRDFELTVVVSLASQDPDGNCWDEPFCGDPDPLVTVAVDGREVARTSEADDTLSHRWTDRPIVVSLTETSEVRLEAYDVDVDTNDFAARCVVKPITAAMVRNGRVTCTPAAGESSVEALIEPL